MYRMYVHPVSEWVYSEHVQCLSMLKGKLRPRIQRPTITNWRQRMISRIYPESGALPTPILEYSSRQPESLEIQGLESMHGIRIRWEIPFRCGNSLYLQHIHPNLGPSCGWRAEQRRLDTNMLLMVLFSGMHYWMTHLRERKISFYMKKLLKTWNGHRRISRLRNGS